MLFMGWGLLTIWRLDPGFGIRQLGWFILACSSLYFLLFYGIGLRWIRRYRYLWITLGLFLMALTLLFGTHPGGGSPRLWLGCCGFYFQPSEALRLLLVAFLASFLADRLTFAGVMRGSWDTRTWLPLILIWLLSFTLLVVQRDLGTGMLFLALLTMLLYLVLDRWQVLAVAGAFGVIGGLLGFYLFNVVTVRVEAWLNPFADPLGGSYQIIQSLIAVASGGIFGRGLGLGSPGFVPAIHTDFIFTAITEEHGLLGALVLIGLWGLWLSRVLSGVLRQREPFAALLSAGLGFSLGLQAMLIVGGNFRVFPLVGITLPFTSYGGSSLLISSISLGMLLLLSQDQESNARFRAPLRRLHFGMIITWSVIAIFLGWWILVRGPELTARGDNPRWAVDNRYSMRGSIFDRDGQVLAETVGTIGTLERVYPQPDAAPIVGYDLFPYGQTGMEETLDGILRGVELQDEWDLARNMVLRGVSLSGSDTRLTLDIELQHLAMQMLADQQGAIVLIDADTGELLSAASAPSYNTNQLENEWSVLINDPLAPLLNRAVQGQYQPGTTLAPFILARSIENGWITLETTVGELAQIVPIDGERLMCATPPEPIRAPDFGDVLRFGCPYPLLELVVDHDPDAFTEMITTFGLVQSIDTELPGEGDDVRFLVTKQELGLAGVGQASLTISPLQLARAFAAFSAGGTMPEIRVVDAVRGQGGEWERYEDSNPSQQVLQVDTAAKIRSALGTDDHFGYKALAIAGESLGWYLGGIRGLAGNYVIVVVLEGGSPTEAAQIGEQLLDSVQAPSIP
jgi:cell division protein FtsW (lipid II flippase)